MNTPSQKQSAIDYAAFVEIELKRCPRCEESLPLSEFGVCRARKDGLNLYCQLCIRQKIKLHRQALREYKKQRTKRLATSTATQQQTAPGTRVDLKLSARRIARMIRKLSPVDRVREAIRHGAHTQQEIARDTKLPKDEVCDHLATLLLWTREIRTEVNGSRKYFINDPSAPPVHTLPGPEEPRSFGVSNIYQCGEPEIRGMSTRYLHND